jgi:hypothetical protein
MLMRVREVPIPPHRRRHGRRFQLRHRVAAMTVLDDARRCYGERLRSGLGLVVVVAVLRRRYNHLAGRRINEMDSLARCTSH